MFWKKHATLGVSVINRNDYADYDYLDKLNYKELRWLKRFHREYVNADFKHNYGIRLYKKRNRKFIYDANNARNRDLYNLKKWTCKLFLAEKIKENTNREGVSRFIGLWL